MKILVTGGSGFIGSHLIDALIEGKHDARSLDQKFPNKKERHYFHGDCVEDFEGCIEGWLPDVVVHLAATSSVNESIEHPDVTNLNNLQKTVELLMLCQAYKVKRFIFASSAAVEDVYSSPYAIQKKAGEEYCRFFARQNPKGLDTVSLRLFNVYGPGAQKGVVAEFCKAIVNGKPLVLKNDGESIRDFIYVADAVKAILFAIDADKNLSKSRAFRHDGTVYPVGTGYPVAVKDVAIMLAGMNDKKTECVDGGKVSEIAYSRGANSLLLPLTLLKDGIAQTLEWWRQQK